MNKFRSVILGLALTFGGTTAAQAVTITNGNFESGPAVGGGGFTTIDSGTALTGWNVTDGGIDYIGSYWTGQAGAGSHSIDLNGNSAGAISQTLNGLTAGVTYVVSFFISGNPDNGQQPNPKQATLLLGNSSNPVSYTLTAVNSSSSMNWQRVSYSFLASGATALLALTSTTPGAYGLAVDNFSISAAPDAATWLTMILGFGLVGAAMRRRPTFTRATA